MDQKRASDNEPLWKLKLDFGDDVTGIHEESWGSESQLRAKYQRQLPGIYFEAQSDADDAQILVFANEADAASHAPAIGEAFAVPA